MTKVEFKAFLDLLMSSDPSPLTDEQDLALQAFADAEAKRHGFQDWIEAYHMVKV
jgi:hypothetical protein